MPPDDDSQFLLGQMNAKLDQLLEGRKVDLERADRLDERIRKLEQWRWLLMGGAVAAGGASSWVAKILGA